jgi:uncharacterized protein YndB with AHSA1/START domain
MRDVVITGSVSNVVNAHPERIFGLVTDIGRLPEWNAIITRVVEQPATVEPGAEWVVELKAFGSSWPSRSQILDLDPATGRFAYRSRTDDGNPSYGDWVWQVTEDPAGTRVTTEWELHPQTFWRRALLARMRHRLLQREVRASLGSLERTLHETGAER